MNGTDIADCDPAQHTAPSQPHQAVLCRSVDHWTNSFVKVGRYFVIAQAVETVDSGWLLAGVSHNCLSRPIFVIANHLNCTEVFLSLSPMTLSALSSADNSFIGFIASSAPLHKYWGHSVDTSPSPQQYCGHSVDIFISTPILRSLCRYISTSTLLRSLCDSARPVETFPGFTVYLHTGSVCSAASSRDGEVTSCLA